MPRRTGQAQQGEQQLKPGPTPPRRRCPTRRAEELRDALAASRTSSRATTASAAAESAQERQPRPNRFAETAKPEAEKKQPRRCRCQAQSADAAKAALAQAQQSEKAGQAGYDRRAEAGGSGDAEEGRRRGAGQRQESTGRRTDANSAQEAAKELIHSIQQASRPPRCRAKRKAANEARHSGPSAEETGASGDSGQRRRAEVDPSRNAEEVGRRRTGEPQERIAAASSRTWRTKKPQGGEDVAAPLKVEADKTRRRMRLHEDRRRQSRPGQQTKTSSTGWSPPAGGKLTESSDPPKRQPD